MNIAKFLRTSFFTEQLWTAASDTDPIIGQEGTDGPVDDLIWKGNFLSCGMLTVNCFTVLNMKIFEFVSQT